MKEHLLKYGTFTEAEVQKVIPFFSKKHYEKKTLIARKGDITRSVFFIHSGCVRLFLEDYSGKEHSILFGTEGYWMGDLQSFVNNTLACYNYQAIEDTDVFAITKTSWDQLMTEEPSFVKYVSMLFRNALIVQQKRIVEFFTLTAEERYENLLKSRNDVVNRVPQKYLASYIGITPEFLSQIRNKRAKS